jgi:hypothetical protein
VPIFVAAKAYTQQQCRNGKAASSQQPRDAVPGVVSDVKNGSRCFADASNDQQPQADLTVWFATTLAGREINNIAWCHLATVLL